MPEQQPDLISNIMDYKELSMDVFINFAIEQALRAQLTDMGKYYLAVESIESVSGDLIEEDKNYDDRIRKKENEILKDIDKVHNPNQYYYELGKFKFRELMKLVRRRLPIDKIGEL